MVLLSAGRHTRTQFMCTGNWAKEKSYSSAVELHVSGSRIKPSMRAPENMLLAK
jgi:hypothetical protein